MKAPYEHELAALDRTYGGALAADVAPLREALTAIGEGPALFIGSGGTMAVAVLAARLHEEVFHKPARACTSLEALDSPYVEQRGAVLFTSSAKHPDASSIGSLS